MSELKDLLSALESSGGDRVVLGDRQTAHAVVGGSRILSVREVPGIELRAREMDGGIAAEIVVRRGVEIERPVHLCFGVLQTAGTQDISLDLRLEPFAAAHFLAHCLFPDARRVRHQMQARIDIGEGAAMRYSESHFHGPYGGTEVIPRAEVRLGKGGRFLSDFSLTSGRVGRLDLDLAVEAAENSVAELVVRVFGHASDAIRIRERWFSGGSMPEV